MLFLHTEAQIEKNEVYEIEPNKMKSLFMKTLADSSNEGKFKFRIRKEEMKARTFQEVDMKQTPIRKYTTDSPVLKESKKNHFRRESIDRFDKLNFKLPSIHIPMKKNPLLNEDFHSKSVSPMKMRLGKLEKNNYENISKMNLPSIFFHFFKTLQSDNFRNTEALNSSKIAFLVEIFG